jgi:hypothetical protein
VAVTQSSQQRRHQRIVGLASFAQIASSAAQVSIEIRVREISTETAHSFHGNGRAIDQRHYPLRAETLEFKEKWQ